MGMSRGTEAQRKKYTEAPAIEQCQRAKFKNLWMTLTPVKALHAVSSGAFEEGGRPHQMRVLERPQWL